MSERSPNGGELERRNHQKKPRSQLPGLTPSQLRYILWLQFRVPLCGKSVDIGTGRTEERLPIIYMKGYHSAEKCQGGKEDCPLYLDDERGCELLSKVKDVTFLSSRQRKRM